MNLLRCHVAGFGILIQRTLEYSTALNVVFAPNEGGKSTLQRFLVGLLCGAFRPDIKNQRRPDPWVEEYRPWRGTDYGGTLWCRLADGRELELRRCFGREESQFQIRSATGEDLTSRYEQQRNGDILFVRTHLGVGKDLFESVAVIRENRVAEIGSRDSIRDRIANLAQAGSEDLSLRASIDKLETALETIGSDRAPTRPYRQALDRLASLQEERESLEKRRAEFGGWVEERNQAAAEVSRLECALRAAAFSTIAARRRDAAGRVRALEELEREILALERRVEASGGNPDFPAHHLDELNQIAGAMESVERRLGEVRAEIEEASLRLARAEAERAEVAAYADLHATVEAEKITEWFVNYMSLSLQRDNAQRSVSLIKEEIAALDRELGGFGPALSAPDIDWHQKSREASDEERHCSRTILALAERISAERATAMHAAARAVNRRILAGVAALLAVLSLALRSLVMPGLVSGWAGAAFAAAFAAAAVALFSAASRARRTRHDGQDRIARLEAEQVHAREEAREALAEIEQAIADSGLRTLEDFLSAAKRVEQLRQKQEELRRRAGETEQLRERLAAECNDLYSRLKDILAGVGLSCAPATLRAQVDLLRANLRRFRDVDARYRACRQSLSALTEESAGLAKESKAGSAAMEAILAKAGVATAEAFRQSCRARQLFLELSEKATSRRREFRRLCGSLTLEQWSERVLELEAAEAAAGPPPEPERERSETADSAEGGAPLLPYRPSTEEAEAEEKRLAADLAARREEHARLAERVRHAFQSYRSVSEIEEDLAATRSALEDMELNRQALAAAIEIIRGLSRRQQEVLAPQLNRAVEQRFLRLCGGRYQEVKIDPDFLVWLREAGTGELRNVDSLSRGTQDQIYFALRFGILDLVSNPAEPSPCLLDEPFAAYDRTRLEEALRILSQEGIARQLFLFTCREDVRDMAGTRGAHVVTLESREIP